MPDDQPDRLQEIEERIARATPGPWIWCVRPGEHLVRLEGNSPAVCVMDFVRWGMGDATPRFRHGLTMHRADSDAAFAHPDARLIRNAPTDLAWAVEEIKRLRETVADLGGRLVRKDPAYQEHVEAAKRGEGRRYTSEELREALGLQDAAALEEAAARVGPVLRAGGYSVPDPNGPGPVVVYDPDGGTGRVAEPKGESEEEP